MNHPLISVIIPTYNRREMLKQALESVLAQDYSNIEIIVGDNASTDGTHLMLAEYCRKYPVIKYIRRPKNLGPVKNGVDIYKQAEGKYFLVLCDDDFLVSPHFFSHAVQDMETQEKVVIVTGGCIFVNEQKKFYEIRPEYADQYYKGIDYYTYFLTNGFLPRLNYFFLARKQLVDQLNIMTTELQAHDYWIWSLLPLYGDIVYLPETIGCYRVQHSSPKDGVAADFAMGFERFYQEIISIHQRAVELYPDKKDKIECHRSIRLEAAHALPLMIDNMVSKLGKREARAVLRRSQVGKDDSFLYFLLLHPKIRAGWIKSTRGIKKSAVSTAGGLGSLFFALLRRLNRTIFRK